MLEDLDPAETREWLEALDSVLAYEGADRALFLPDEVVTDARRKGAPVPQRRCEPGRWSPSVSGSGSRCRVPELPGRAGMRCRMVIFSGPMRMSLTSSRGIRWRSSAVAVAALPRS